MTLVIKARNLHKELHKLTVDLHINYICIREAGICQNTTENYNIGGVVFLCKVIALRDKIMILVSFNKLSLTDESIDIVRFSQTIENKGGITVRRSIADYIATKSVVWHVIYENPPRNTDFFPFDDSSDEPLNTSSPNKSFTHYKSLKMTCNVEVIPTADSLNMACVTIPVTQAVVKQPFASLYEDTDLTDFELRGEDGSVFMHKTVLAIRTTFFKTLFRDKKEEKTVGVVVPNTCKVTLQHLKDYLYMDTLPDTGLGELLLLASSYMITELEERCVLELTVNVTSAKALEVIQFAAKHDLTNILLKLLKRIEDGVLKVDYQQHIPSIMPSESDGGDDN